MRAFGGNAQRDDYGVMTQRTPFNADFYDNNYQRLKENIGDDNQVNRMKAYLNFVLFDDNFNLVNSIVV